MTVAVQPFDVHSMAEGCNNVHIDRFKLCSDAFVVLDFSLHST